MKSQVKMLLTISGSWGENNPVWSEHGSRKEAILHARSQVRANDEDGKTRGEAVLVTDNDMDCVKGIR